MVAVLLSHWPSHHLLHLILLEAREEWGMRYFIATYSGIAIFNFYGPIYLLLSSRLIYIYQPPSHCSHATRSFQHSVITLENVFAIGMADPHHASYRLSACPFVPKYLSGAQIIASVDTTYRPQLVVEYSI